MQSPVLVVGSSVVDLTFYSARIPAIGETVAGRFVQGLGGKGFNQAVAARRAGAEVTFLSALGADGFAPQFETRLRELGIPGACERIASESTGAAAISVDTQGRNNIIVALGANARLNPAFLDQNIESFKGISALLLQFETNLEVVARALELTRKHSPDAVTILNPAPAITPIPHAILSQVDLFTPNETELEAISGVHIQSDADLKRACATIQGPGAVLATLGEKGAVLWRRGEMHSFPAFPVRAIDTTGAGDAFNGGLACGIALFGRAELPRAIRFASAVAAISVTREGTSASMPDATEVRAFLDQHRT
jgi:ribokinase